MKKPVILIGGGGHARVLADVLRKNAVPVLGFTDISETVAEIGEIKRIGTDDDIYDYKRDAVLLVNGIGSVGNTALRRTVFEKFRNKGFSFMTVVHPSAVIASDARLSEGVQIMAGVVVQPGVRIGANSLVNTGATLDHDCVIGDHVHIAPGVTMCGGVRVEDGVHIGAGATVVQGVKIGRYSVIGAGAVVIRDVPTGSVVAGVPAKEVGRREKLE